MYSILVLASELIDKDCPKAKSGGKDCPKAKSGGASLLRQLA